MNPTISKAIRIATISGGAILVVNSATKLMGVKSVKEAAMPLISILVGIAAFQYALKSNPITVVEKK
jgi:hypothetical protein